VGIDFSNESAVALINDDSTEVGCVHFGVVHIIKVADEAVASRIKEGIVSPEFVPVAEAVKDAVNYETWSRFCLERIEMLLAMAAGKRI